MTNEPSDIVRELARAFGADERMLLMTQVGALATWLALRFDPQERERAVEAARSLLGLDDQHARRLADLAGFW